MNKDTIWLSCGVLRAEMSELHQTGKIGGRLLFMDSMLHMNPPKLEKNLSEYLAKFDSQGEQIVLVYGDCCAQMIDLAGKYKVTRVDAINCAQMLVGKDRYRELMHMESFIFLPEWTLRWQEIMQQELGLNSDIAKSLMGENRKELVYFDTGLVPVPHKELAACSEYAGLPWRVEKVEPTELLNLLLAAQNKSQA